MKSLLNLLSSPNSINKCEFHQRREDETNTAQEPNLTGLNIGDLRQRLRL